MTAMTRYSHGQFCWIDLASHDLAAAQAFYEKVLGWKAVTLDTQGGPAYAIFESGGGQVAGIGQMSDEMQAQGIPPCWNSYINVDDVVATTNRAAQLGGTVTVPVMKILDAGSLSFIQDPTGGVVGLWQADRHIGAQRLHEPGALCWNELATTDLERAKEFFGPLLQWEFTPDEDAPMQYDLIWNNGRENGGMLQMTEEWAGVPPHWMVYFAVADVDATVSTVQSAGGSVCVQPFDVPFGRIAVLDDPQHAVFSAIQLAG